MHKNKFLENFNLFSILFIFIIDLLLIIFIQASWNSTANTLHPLNKEITTLRNNLTEAHLWLEEAIGGDYSINIKKDVLVPFEHRDFNNFLKNLDLPKEQQDIKKEFEEINIKLKQLYELASKRWGNTKENGIGSAMDQEFDGYFKQILKDIDATIQKINDRTIASIDEKNDDFKIIITFLILVNLLFFISLFIMNKYSKKLKERERILVRNSKLASMGEMLGNIAHQWRQPLNLISVGTTSLKIKKEMGSLKDEYFNEVIDSINKNVQYLSQTINDFSNFIRIDKEPSLFNLETNINSFIKLIQSSLKAYKIKTVIKLQEDITIKGFPNELSQILMNLYNNSKDAFEEDKESKDKRYIFIDSYRKDKFAVIEFKDTAGGIPNEIKDKIFEPYFTTKHQTEGTGLGLHMTYNIIINSMAGEVLVSNEEFRYNKTDYKGCKFTLLIPLKL